MSAGLGSTVLRSARTHVLRTQGALPTNWAQVSRSNLPLRSAPIRAYSAHTDDSHGAHGSHSFETSPPPTAGSSALVAAGAAAAALVAYLIASRKEVVPSYKLVDFAPVSTGASATTTTTATTAPKSSGNSASAAAATTTAAATAVKEVKETKEVASTAEESAEKRTKAVVTEELMDATKCLPGYLSERLSEFKIGMLRDDIIGLSAELKNGKKVLASVVGTINNEYKTIGLWPESAARNGFDKGVVVYLKDSHVVGVLLWGLTQQADVARNLLKRSQAVADPKELYHLFSL